MADQSKISNSITQAQADAEALYAKAASIDPYTAALIKKNAQGNLLSPGVLTSLSQLGVDAKSGVAASIANIDAATRDQRLADQKKAATDREVKKFEETFRGQAWKVVKGVSMGAMTTLGTTWNWMTAQGRQGIEGIAQATRAFGVSSAAKPLGATPPIKEKYIPSAFEQTVAGQMIIKSIQDGKKGQFPKFDLGTGFFPSEETGQGYAARQASLSAAKVAILDSNGNVKGYRPASLFGDAYASIFTMGHPESQAGQVLSLAADIAGSFALDPGLGRASQIKELKKIAAQQRAANAATAAAKTEDRIAQLTKLEDEALADAAALKKQADALNKIDLDSARAARNEARAARSGAAEDVIKSKQSVKIAQSRLDDFKVIEQREVENLASATKARQAVEAVAKAPKNAARAEKLLAAQRKQLEEMTADRASALERGLTPFVPEEDITSLANAIKLTEQQLAEATALIGKKPIPQEVIDNAIELEKKAKARVKEIKGEVAYVTKQVAERSRTQRLMEGVRERAMSDTVKATKNEKTLSEKLSDATLSLKDKRKSWELAVLRLANADQTLERPEFAYQHIAEFLTNGRGTKAVDRLVEIADWKTLWRKADGRLTHEQAKALAGATTPDEVVDILAPYIKRGQIQAGALEPGRLVRMGETIAERTQFAVPMARRLVGVGAKVQSRINEHAKVASFFEGFIGGIKAPVTILKPKLERGYKVTVKAGTIINIHDREELLRSVEDFGTAADLPKDVLDNLIDEIANAQSNSVAGYAASVKLLDAVFAAKAEKIPANMKEAFEDYTTAFKESAEQMSSYWATRHAQGANLKYMMLNGESVILPGAHLDSEFLNSTIYLPPVAELLKMTSKVAKYPAAAWSRKVGDTLIGDYWKTIQLVRPAYIIRNIAEEQIRVGAVGHASFFTRPGMALAMWLGKEDGPWVRRLLKQFDTYSNTVFDESFTSGDDALDILDETLAHGMKNSYIDMMNSAKSGFDERDFRVLSLKNVAPVEFGHPRFFDGVANQLRMLNSSEMARVVAGYDPKFVKDAVANGQFRNEAVIDYFLTGPGRKQLDRFAEGTPDDFRAFIKTPEGLKAYLFTGKDPKGNDISVLARINETTGGNKALQNMVAYGKVNVGGVDLVIPRPSKDAINSIQNSKAMKAGKKALLDEQAALSKEIKKFFGESGNWDGVRVNVPSKNAVYAEKSVDRSRFVEWFFEKSTELEKNSTFGPEFRQAYWDAINDIAKALDSNAKAKLFDVAQNSLTPLQRARRSSFSTGKIFKEEQEIIDILNSQRAKGFTIDSLKEFEDSLINYTNGSGNYSLVNSFLRGDYAPSAKDVTTANKIISDLDALIAKAPKLNESITTFRGISDKTVVDKLLSLKPGDSFVDNAFVSTSLKESAAERFARSNGVIVEIINPAGTKGIFPLGLRTEVNSTFVSRANAENEFLLPRGTKFYVTEVKGNKIKVTLENVSDSYIGSKHPVWNAFKSATGDGPLTLEDAHIYADNYARRHVKDLFYNAHEKRLIFHQLRLIAPFANAWENTVRKWSELALDNPVGVYKAVKGIEWATKPASSAIYQMTDAQDYYDPNQGFFFTDPNTGQRQFFVPFTGTVMAGLAKAATGANYTGAPIAFSANPMSFNFAFGAGTMLPGIGPGVTLPLSALGTFNGNFIDAMPLGVQKWLFPFGRANFSGGLQTAILPGNWNRILGGLTGMEQTYASNFKPIMNYLASGANYNLDNPDDQARLVADTDTFARWESVMRGVIGLVSPMALIQQGLAKDKDGDLTLQTALYEDFQTMYQANDGDYNKTWFDFLNTYGASQAFAIISSSAGEGPSNWDSYAFVVSNPDVATKYKDVWGYVMPGGGLSTEMYQWNVSHGLKKQLTPTQILQKVNNQRFYAAKDALLSRVDAGEFNRNQYSEALANLKNIMGGGPVVEFDPNKRERVLRQLNELVADERFVDLPSIAGLRDYMFLRQDILSKIGKTKFTGAQNEQGARDYLAAQAEWIVKDNPDFQKMFYAFFANELEGK